MAKRGDGDPGGKPVRRNATGDTRLDSGFGRPKGDKPRSSSAAVPSNIFEFKSTTSRSERSTRARKATVKAGKTKVITKLRTKRKNTGDTVKSPSTVRLEEALAHYNKVITTAEARRMNEIIEADLPTAELRPRRR
ncbi:hypothetical protein AB0O22_31810 [Streptomyces sp. NPDC091204]|uniref:hypothetical protein n=1 Tax=Streptomyces sp. NPDC091204 TaxID=3155299 RepID=UPI003443A2D2